jgi:hypothetical protein
MGNKTLYEILEVSEAASEEMIENSYKFLIDKAKKELYENNFAEYENRIIVLRDSFNILNNKDKRLAYDKSQAEKKWQYKIPQSAHKVVAREPIFKSLLSAKMFIVIGFFTVVFLAAKQLDNYDGISKQDVSNKHDEALEQLEIQASQEERLDKQLEYNNQFNNQFLDDSDYQATRYQDRKDRALEEANRLTSQYQYIMDKQLEYANQLAVKEQHTRERMLEIEQANREEDRDYLENIRQQNERRRQDYDAQLKLRQSLANSNKAIEAQEDLRAMKYGVTRQKLEQIDHYNSQR